MIMKLLLLILANNQSLYYFWWKIENVLFKCWWNVTFFLWESYYLELFRRVNKQTPSKLFLKKCLSVLKSTSSFIRFYLTTTSRIFNYNENNICHLYLWMSIRHKFAKKSFNTFLLSLDEFWIGIQQNIKFDAKFRILNSNSTKFNRRIHQI